MSNQIYFEEELSTSNDQCVVNSLREY